MKRYIVCWRGFAKVCWKVFLSAWNPWRSSTKSHEMLLTKILKFFRIFAFIKCIIIAITSYKTIFNFEGIRGLCTYSKSLLRKAFSACNFNFWVLIIDKLHEVGIPLTIGSGGSFFIQGKGSSMWLFSHIKIKIISIR